jgi:hypothetical protein
MLYNYLDGPSTSISPIDSCSAVNKEFGNLSMMWLIESSITKR